MTHALVATDGSGQSLKAARQVRTLLASALEQVSVVAVIRPLAAVPFANDFGEEDQVAREQDPTGLAFRAAAQVQTYVRSGTPAEEIVRAADDLDADLIVVGGRGKGPSRRSCSGASPTGCSTTRPAPSSSPVEVTAVDARGTGRAGCYSPMLPR